MLYLLIVFCLIISFCVLVIIAARIGTWADRKQYKINQRERDERLERALTDNKKI